MIFIMTPFVLDLLRVIVIIIAIIGGIISETHAFKKSNSLEIAVVLVVFVLMSQLNTTLFCCREPKLNDDMNE